MHSESDGVVNYDDAREDDKDLSAREPHTQNFHTGAIDGAEVNSKEGGTPAKHWGSDSNIPQSLETIGSGFGFEFEGFEAEEDLKHPSNNGGITSSALMPPNDGITLSSDGVSVPMSTSLARPAPSSPTPSISCEPSQPKNSDGDVFFIYTEVITRMPVAKKEGNTIVHGVILSYNPSEEAGKNNTWTIHWDGESTPVNVEQDELLIALVCDDGDHSNSIEENDDLGIQDDKEETKAEGYDCPHPSCEKTCPTLRGLKSHFAQSHPGEGWIGIDESGIVTIAVGDREYVCDECMVKFKNNDSLTKHINASKFLFMSGQKR